MFQQPAERSDGPLSVRSMAYGEEVVIVALAGELDLANVGAAETAIMAAQGDEATRLVIDLQELEFLDSAGVALLCRVGALPDARDRVRVIPSKYGGVGKVLALTGVTSRLQFIQDGASRLPEVSGSGSR